MYHRASSTARFHMQQMLGDPEKIVLALKPVSQLRARPVTNTPTTSDETQRREPNASRRSLMDSAATPTPSFGPDRRPSWASSRQEHPKQ